MPRLLEDFSTKHERVEIGTKEDFLKLQARRGVVGADSEAIRKAVEAVEHVTPHVSNVRGYVRPFEDLTRAVKEFTAKYKTKHPKFIADVEKDFVAPVRAIIEKGQEWQKTIANTPQYFLEVITPLDQVSIALSDGALDDTKLETAIDGMTTAGSAFGNAKESLRIVGEQFGIDSIKKLYEIAQAKHPDFEKVARILRAARQAHNHQIDLGPITITVLNLAHTSKTMAEAVAKVGITA